jgi:hypothetical protein
MVVSLGLYVWVAAFVAIVVMASHVEERAALLARRAAVVSARIEVCGSCKLDNYPRIARFVREESAAFPALEVRYIEGRDPDLIFVNPYGRDHPTVHALAFSTGPAIEALLAQHGITRTSPKPVYLPFEPLPTTHCIGWRQTLHCGDPQSSSSGLESGPERDPQADEDCLTRIEHGRSGYCECAGGAVRGAVGCSHAPLYCEDVCGNDAYMEAVLALLEDDEQRDRSNGRDVEYVSPDL